LLEVLVRVPYSPPIEEAVTHEVTVFFCVYTTDGEKNIICFIDGVVLLINNVCFEIKIYCLAIRRLLCNFAEKLLIINL